VPAKDKKYWSIRRKKIISILKGIAGGKCKICGYSKCKDVLHFHHKEPSKKSFGINNVPSLKSGLEEIKKCILVCANCHGELHYKNKSKNIIV
jgi:hypothetical protein